MEANETQQAEKLLEEMLGFLESSTDEEDEDSVDDEDAYESAKDEQIDLNDKEQPCNPLHKCSAKSSIAKEIEKLRNSLPTWSPKDIAPTAKRLMDPIWRKIYGSPTKLDQSAIDKDWNTKLKSNCRRSGNSFVKEVSRAIYANTSEHPANNSPDYFQAAQNYAIYGKDFLDFPENLAPLLGEKSSTAPVVSSIRSSSPYFPASSHRMSPGCGNGLYPTPIIAHESAHMNYANFGKHLAAFSGTSTAAYYQMYNGLQPVMRSPGGTASGSNAYGMYLGNKLTYVAAAPTAPPPLVYNQHSSTTTNFISNSLANAALASPPAIQYNNPMLTTTTQQYLNTFFKDTQYLSGATAQGTTTGIYERLVYAQMLQQQIYHQTQQQAAAVAVMFQHKHRPRSSGYVPMGVPTGACGGVSAAVGGPVSWGGVGCGRQSSIANTSPTEILANNVSFASGGEELATTAALPE